MRPLLATLALAILSACGDNSQRCGPGTTDEQGTCMPTCGPGTVFDTTAETCVPDGTILCADGTMLNTTTGMCVVDPDDCQDGTVLFQDRCVDPNSQLPVDLLEGTEPNGDGVIEASLNPAGLIMLKAVGDPNGFIIHGTIAPFRDANNDGLVDPDVDTYLVTVTAPTLIHVRAQGVHGIVAGFLAVDQVAAPDPLTSWQRFGMNLATSTSQRQIYLPAPGTYAFAIADTRTLFQYSTGGPIDAAPGPGDYYITIDQLALATPTALSPSSGTAMQTGMLAADSSVQFYTLAAGSEPTTITLAMPDLQTIAAVVAADNGVLAGLAYGATGTTTNQPAELTVTGFSAGDTPLVVVDDLYDTANDPTPYTLTITTM